MKMNKLLIYCSMLILSACAAERPIGHPYLEKEFGGVELGTHTTPLANDIDKALKYDKK